MSENAEESNKNTGTQYEELEVQQSYESVDYDSGSELYDTYLNVQISVFGKAFIVFMMAIFALSLCFLIFSFSDYGKQFLRQLKINII